MAASERSRLRLVESKLGRSIATVDSGGEPPDDPGMEPRVAKLEAIADSTSKTLDLLQRRMDDGFKDLRAEMRDLRNDSASNFRWIVGIQLTTLLAIVGVLAKAAKLF